MTTTNQGEKFNITFDLGHFLVNDAQTFNKDAITEAEIKQRTITNLELFYKELFKLSGKQAGEDSENRDFDKPKDCVKLPDPVLKLPRAKPIPKPKPLTKWEKYRVEKGLPPRQKRSRMVFSELAQDWVPRWGKGRYDSFILLFVFCFIVLLFFLFSLSFFLSFLFEMIWFIYFDG